MPSCEGRVAIVTGAGRGLGRAHALELARCGAMVVVNDLGVGIDGTGGSTGPASSVVEEIREMGGIAEANHDDVADEEGAAALVSAAIERFGALDILVNNAGILRDGMLVHTSGDDWDAVIRVHARATFLTTRGAARYWRECAKAGRSRQARVINTTSSSGLYGTVGQANYSAAKAAIATFSRVAAAELRAYGVTVNAVAPAARTRMTEELFPDRMAPVNDGFDSMDPVCVARFVAWLASLDSEFVTGQVFSVSGEGLAVVSGWRPGRFVCQPSSCGSGGYAHAIRELLQEAPVGVPVHGARAPSAATT